MKEKYSWSVVYLAHERVGICGLLISNARRNVCLNVNVRTVNISMIKIVAYRHLSAFANIKERQFNQEKVSPLETVKLGKVFTMQSAAGALMRFKIGMISIHEKITLY